MRVVRLTKQKMEQYYQQLIRLDAELVELMGEHFAMDKWTEQNFLSDYPGKWKYSVIALEDEAVLGVIIATSSEEGAVHINRFFVRCEEQKNGVGGKMLDTLEENLINQKINSVDLFVNVKNENAIRFYKKNGFCCLQFEYLKDKLNLTNRVGYNETYVENPETHAKMFFMQKKMR